MGTNFRQNQEYNLLFNRVQGRRFLLVAST
jgi:hypothetical protein